MAEEATAAPAAEGDSAGGEAAAEATLHPSAEQEAAPAAPAQAEPASEAPAEAPAENPAEAEQTLAAIDPNFKMPEGMELDADVAQQFVPLAQDLKLNQEQAQQLADFYAAEKAKAIEAQAKEWEKTNAEWQDQTHADDEIGGDKLDESLGFANKALDKYGSPELKEALTATGAGNHPEFIRFMTRVGKAMSEDTIGVGTATPTGQSNLDRAKILFPDHK